MSVDLLLQLHEQCKGCSPSPTAKTRYRPAPIRRDVRERQEPGTALAVQKSPAAARKPFRLYKPIEILVPFLRSPFDFAANAANAAVEYAKNIDGAYFGRDHVVRTPPASPADAALAKNMQKLAWAGSPPCAGLYS